jgi:hypothetical protein
VATPLDLARVGMIARRYEKRLSDAELEARLANMIVILSAPRSGSTLLFDLLSRTPDVVTLGGESHVIYRQFPQLTAEDEAFSSGALDARHADPVTVRRFRCAFLAMLHDRSGRLLHDRPEGDRVILEKTPRNALALPFLQRVFPEARFVFLYRHPAETIASLIEGWETGLTTGQFVTFRRLPGWDRAGWCFALPRGWQALRGRSLAEIAAFQWLACNREILGRLGGESPERVTAVSYADVIAEPVATLARIGQWTGLPDLGERWRGAALPLSSSTVSAPAPGKWLQRERQVSAVVAPALELLTEIEGWQASPRR